MNDASPVRKFVPPVNIPASNARAKSPLKSSPRKVTESTRTGWYEKKPILERIESGLTVSIGPDLRMMTGKEPPKYVNRANGASPKRVPTAKGGAAGKGARAGAKSAGKPGLRRAATNPTEVVHLQGSVGIALGNKYFKNAAFER